MWWMVMMTALAADPAPVLVVATPGVALDAYAPLLEALQAAGHETDLVSFACAGQDTAALEAHVEERLAKAKPNTVLVGHSFGANLALGVASRRKVAKVVALAPVLDLWPSLALRELAQAPVGAVLDLSGDQPWRGGSLRDELLGADVPIGCVPSAFAREVQQWTLQGDVPLDLESVTAPVWVGVSLGDDIASVEAVVPASRRLPDRKVVRLGITRLDPQDYAHGEMLVGAVPIKAAVKAVEAEW